jgi:chloride channel 2
MSHGSSSTSSSPSAYGWQRGDEAELSPEEGWRQELVPLALDDENERGATEPGNSEEDQQMIRRERRRQASRRAQDTKWYHKLWKQVRRQVRRQQTWVFLLVLGLVAAMIGLAMEETMHQLIWSRNKLASLTNNYFVNYMAWVAFGMASCTLAAALVHVVGPYSAGSGIPAVKSILSGVLMEHYLSFRTLITKITGLICVYAAGLFVGKEGPYVHISTALASQLARLPFFEKIQRNEGLKLQLFAAGCAAGVAVTFGAPIGGVIFSIEVTTTYYLIQNLSKGFFCAIVATLFTHLLDTHGLIAFFSTDFAPTPYTSAELVAFSLIGITFGLLGVAFNLYVKKLAQLRRNYKIFNQSRYGQVLIIAMISGLVTFPIIPLRNGPTAVLNDLFSTAPLKNWQSPNVYFVLVAVVVLEFVMCGISVGLPIPCGLYTPMFILGAALGRLIGEVLNSMHILPGLVPAGYAVVGAAAFASATTRTLSSSIICFELTRQLEHLLPVLLAVLIASAVGNFFGPSIYEELLKMKGLPYMPPFKSSQGGNKTAKAIMRKDVMFLTTDSTYEDIQNLLIQSHYDSFPLVHSNKQRTLLGILPRVLLEGQLDKLESRLSSLAHRQVEILNLALQDSAALIPSPEPTSKTQDGQDGDSTQTTQVKEPKSIEPNFKSRYGGLYASLHLDVDSKDQDSLPESQKLQNVMHTLTQQAMNEPVGFSRKTPGLDAGPFQLPVQTPHSKVHFLFAMLGLKCAYIVDQGDLVGVITKRDLINLQ